MDSPSRCQSSISGPLLAHLGLTERENGLTEESRAEEQQTSVCKRCSRELCTDREIRYRHCSLCLVIVMSDKITAVESHYRLPPKRKDEDEDDSEPYGDQGQERSRQRDNQTSSASTDHSRREPSSKEDQGKVNAMAGKTSRPLEPVVTRAMHERAEEARRLHERMGHPSDTRLKQTISYGKIVNCHLKFYYFFCFILPLPNLIMYSNY